MEWTAAPPARACPPDCIGDTPLEDIGPSGDRATGGDRCCQPPRRRVSAGARRRRPSGNEVGNMPVAAVTLPAATPHTH